MSDDISPYYIQFSIRKRQLYMFLYIIVFSLAQWQFYHYAYKRGVKDAFNAIERLMNTKEEEPTTNG